MNELGIINEIVNKANKKRHNKLIHLSVSLKNIGPGNFVKLLKKQLGNADYSISKGRGLRPNIQYKGYDMFFVKNIKQDWYIECRQISFPASEEEKINDSWEEIWWLAREMSDRKRFTKEGKNRFDLKLKSANNTDNS